MSELAIPNVAAICATTRSETLSSCSSSLNCASVSRNSPASSRMPGVSSPSIRSRNTGEAANLPLARRNFCQSTFITPACTSSLASNGERKLRASREDNASTPTPFKKRPTSGFSATTPTSAIWLQLTLSVARPWRRRCSASASRKAFPAA